MVALVEELEIASNCYMSDNTLYIGYSMGIALVIGFNYGNKNGVQQKNVFRISNIIKLRDLLKNPIAAPNIQPDFHRALFGNCNGF